MISIGIPITVIHLFSSLLSFVPVSPYIYVNVMKLDMAPETKIYKTEKMSYMRNRYRGREKKQDD